MHGIAMLHLDSLQPRLKKAVADYKIYSAELAHECMARSSDEKESACVFDVLLEGYRQGGSDAPTIQELESESSLLVLAGKSTWTSDQRVINFNCSSS